MAKTYGDIAMRMVSDYIKDLEAKIEQLETTVADLRELAYPQPEIPEIKEAHADGVNGKNRLSGL